MTQQDIYVNQKAFVPFISAQTLAQRVKELAKQLEKDYADKTVHFLGVLNGSFMFLSDLMKHYSLPSQVEFVKLASYQGLSSSGKVKEIFGLPNNLAGKHLVVVEDIVDTGLTMQFLLKELNKSAAASVSICTLLLKPEALQQPIVEMKYIGFEIPNEFVLGYGLDYDGLGRNLNSIYKAK